MDLYENLTDLNVLYESFIKCKKDVSWKYSTQKYESNCLMQIYKLRESLLNGTYKQKPFSEFDICERGKPRHIKALHISDRVLQRALCDNILMPQLEKYLIYDNAASVKGKGIDFARERMRCHLRRYYINEGTNEGYILQVDFRKFFDSIDTDIAIRMLEDKIPDKRVMDLIRYLMSTFGEGVGIGSQLSQVVGLYFPTPIDNYVKIVRGCKYYARYMDDLYVIHRDKEYLKDILSGINEQAKRLHLTINENKTRIVKINKRFTYLKIRFRLSDSGKVYMVPVAERAKRERRKLRMFYRNGYPKDYIDKQFLTVMGTYDKYDAKRAKESLIEYKQKMEVAYG